MAAALCIGQAQDARFASHSKMPEGTKQPRDWQKVEQLEEVGLSCFRGPNKVDIRRSKFFKHGSGTTTIGIPDVLFLGTKWWFSF